MEDKEKLNILILSWRGPGHPNAGGAEISTHEHAKGWVKGGHQVTLFTSLYPRANKEEIVDGVRIVRRGGQVLGVHWEAFKWYVFENHQKYDLVVDQFHGIPFFTPFYVKVRKLAFIHEVTKEVWRLNPWPWPFCLGPKILGPIIEPLIFKLFYRNIPFMTVSESTRKDLIEWGIPRQNINVIHNGIQFPRMVFPKKQTKKTITFLGALAKDKGIEDAINIFSILQRRYKDSLQYWIIGKADSRYQNFLKNLITSLGLTDVKFWDFVSEKKKFELLAGSYILINPSIREGWGLVVIEAARVGTPTIAFDVSGLRDSVIDNKTGVLSKGLTQKDLADQVINLLENEQKYNRMSQAAMIWSRNFSWEKASAMSLCLIEKIAD
ncbi:MAG: glycosyltransferase family 4 protein [Candidatus Daviesbacteria bacterium]|nr:glycosyltransferase family 4 protein [Candidatus Daviesbacteria bacterium]